MRLKKGSKEAKAFMAKLRNARKKKAAPKKAVKKATPKKAANKRKPATKKATTHKDTKSHNVNIRVVSGVGNLDTTNIQELQRLLRMNTEMLRLIDNIKKGPNAKSLLSKATILRFRQNIAYNKKRITDLKKLIK